MILPYCVVIKQRHKGKTMGLKIRFLLTSKCTAACRYCHNEGQSMVGNLLPLDTIRQVLHTLHANALASINKVILIGNLGADPELRSFPNGDQVCNLRLATTDTWKDKASGEKRESTELHRVVLYRKLAEIAGQYLRKGSQVYVEGHIRTRKWKDKDGQERYSTEIEANEMTILGGNGQGSAPAAPPAASGESWAAELGGTKGSTKAPEWINDLPF